MFGFTTNFSLIETLKREGAPVEHLQYSADSICNQIGDADEGKFPIRTKNDVSFFIVRRIRTEQGEHQYF